MLRVVVLGDDHGAGLEDEHPGAQLGEFLDGPAAGHPRADDDGVVILAAWADVHEPRSAGESGTHPSKVRNEVR